LLGLLPWLKLGEVEYLAGLGLIDDALARSAGPTFRRFNERVPLTVAYFDGSYDTNSRCAISGQIDDNLARLQNLEVLIDV
jgi:hypothetical protein